ncbi:hypothetical protein [Frateuria sp. YIM B11624]|uniref:hypothetical protein n=1 Tax=Frateuria sp. YIM B11624 TaxID=3143185 RepID=UPI003C7546C4
MTDEPSQPSADDPFDGLRGTLKPQLRLFLSADIVGSTAFKQRRDEDGWFDIVLRFYQYAETSFMRHWNLGRGPVKTKQQQHAALFGESPTLWKTIGDEVTFSKQITHPAQVMTTLHAWIAALDDLRALLMKNKQDQLDVKASAWLADFPLRNREVALRVGVTDQPDDTEREDGWLTWRNDSLLGQYPGKEGVHLIKDYVGPSIDTGFRLGASASPRRLAISVELAYVVAGEIINLENEDPIYKIASFQIRPLTLKYDQMLPLKGVLGGAPYPMIWIDVLPREELHQFEDELRGVAAAPADKIRGFAGAYMKAHADKLCTLFMQHDPELPEEYGKFPVTKNHRLAEKERELKSLHAKLDVEQEALAVEDKELKSEQTNESAEPATGKRSLMDLRALLDNIKPELPV